MKVEESVQKLWVFFQKNTKYVVTYDGCLSISGLKIHLPETGVIGICTLPDS